MPVRRVQHAEKTRAEILSEAVRLAAREGLEGLTIGRLSEAVGMSKGGLFAHFGSKEALQLATVDAAGEQLVTEVLVPATRVAGGLPRLRTALDLYFDYVKRRSSEGGCFFTAASLEFDDRPGQVRERIKQTFEAVRDFLESSLAEAGLSKETCAQLAFEAWALSLGSNATFQLTKDPAVFRRARTALETRLKPFLS
jgi:AcrR family transcriptional regulator